MKILDKEKKTIIEVDDCPLYEWLRCYKQLNYLGFSNEEITKALNDANMDINSLTDRSNQTNIMWLTYPYDILKENHSFKQYWFFAHKCMVESQKDRRNFRFFNFSSFDNYILQLNFFCPFINVVNFYGIFPF